MRLNLMQRLYQKGFVDLETVQQKSENEGNNIEKNNRTLMTYG